MSVSPHCTKIETDILAKALYDLAKVHTAQKKVLQSARITLKKRRVLTSGIRRQGTGGPDVQKFAPDAQYASCHRDRLA